MKITVFSLTLMLGTVVSAAPTLQSIPGLVNRDTPEETIDCGYCTGMLDFCFKNGHTQGQEGCKQTCREHVCHRTPECKNCHGEFDQCPEKSRY
ncbi:uncharacterized protein EKO05_0000807 [Ascochyta rabiei]|uniref:Uncharacterized protein n=1 Tax=Didymella rabiei TaxID=5454 RepID=A0A163CI20_DIDRA|nr:uncharacterized protein EKO05_0000807 [Ascochyta rabiei]KZM22478.1 hypothetical protein ST47_g6391 [Ascochyta rabiei]UPX10136.1 hypothetical protein EKO05_0000807 [Ascochyta rabiei]